jgi:hypothetical protein
VVSLNNAKPKKRIFHFVGKKESQKIRRLLKTKNQNKSEGLTFEELK